MGNSIQDQLLKAGLGNKKQAVKARKAQNQKQKLKASGVKVEDEAEVLAREAQQEKVERDRELNRQKQAEADAKAIAAQIQQLIEMNRIEERGETEFAFSVDAIIRTLQLTDTHRKQVVSGKLAIARLGGGFEVVPRQVAEKIAERDSSVIVLKNDSSEVEEAGDDEYADYQVPDDLMW